MASTTHRLFYLILHLLLLLPRCSLANNIENVAGATQESNVDQIKASFDKNGFVVLRDFFDVSQLELWQSSAEQFFQSVFEIMHAKGHTQFPTPSRIVRISATEGQRELAMGIGKHLGFREIVMRSPGRYEISLEALQSVNSKQQPTLEGMVEKLAAIAPALLDTTALNMSLAPSLIVSTPGAPEQSWHTDGEHVTMQEHMPAHCLNVFIPLINVTSHELGPTDMIPNSHRVTRQPSPMKLDLNQLQQPYAPLLNVGDILMFDYRLLHRGKANQSNQNRPMLVLAFSQSWFKDKKNWPERSLSD